MSRDDLIPKQDALSILGVGQSTLGKFVKNGKIAQYGGGRGGVPALYNRDEILRFKEEREAQLLQPLKVA